MAGLPFVGAAAWAGGMLGWSPQPLVRALPVGALLFVVPALAEEMVFRAALLPRPGEPASAFRLAWPLAAFVFWHPLQAWTIGPSWSATFLQPWFLVAVAVLGATLTAVYRVTGSVWACAVVHWAAVGAWKLLFDGPF